MLVVRVVRGAPRLPALGDHAEREVDAGTLHIVRQTPEGQRRFTFAEEIDDEGFAIFWQDDDERPLVLRTLCKGSDRCASGPSRSAGKKLVYGAVSIADASVWLRVAQERHSPTGGVCASTACPWHARLLSRGSRSSAHAARTDSHDG
jgi:hypothetical protein